MIDANTNVIPLDRKAEAAEVVASALRSEKTITQDGIARIFAARYAGRLLYCHSTGSWFEFAGTHWGRDETDRAFHFVREIAREQTEGKEARELKAMRTTAFANGVERFARSDPVFAVTATYWDRDGYLLGTPGGTVELRTGKLRPSKPEDGITKLAAVSPSEHSDCPTWKNFIRDATNGDDELGRFLQQWFGYCLTGDVREHALVFGYGPGGNGKSVMLNTVSRILADYATTVPAETFATSTNDRHPTELARLRGARLVAASETEHGRVWAESRVKALTGGDKIAARFMRGDFFEFEPQHKLMIIGNYQPQLHHVDEAMRRRFLIVPFLHRPAVSDLHLEDALREEWPEILRWMINGCLDWQQRGLMRPRAVLAATEEYFADQDLFGQWLSECCELHRGSAHHKAPSAALYASWTAFAKAAGQQVESEKAFAGNLKRRGPVPSRDNKVRGYAGIILKPKGTG
jgi:putative DNA primase/helicase